MDRRMDGGMEGWMDGGMDGWMDGWMDGQMDGWMDGQMDGWMDGWMDRLGSSYVGEYYSAMKRNRALTCATVWMDLRHMTLRESSRHKRPRHVWPCL